MIKKFSFKAVALATSFIMLLMGSMACQKAADSTPASAEDAYKSFIEKQKEEKNTDTIYAAITNTSEDGSPVLLIAEEVIEANNQTANAELYNFVDGEVVKICEISSGSTAYPIASYDGKYLVSASHHTLETYLVSGDSAEIKEITGIAMDDGTGSGSITYYSITKEQPSDDDIQDISLTEADEAAAEIYESWEPIQFEKY